MRTPHPYDGRDTLTEDEIHEWARHVDQESRERFEDLTAHLPRSVEYGLAAHALPIVEEVLAIVKPQRIVEIGFGAGCSAAMWLSYPKLRRLVSIDWTTNPRAIEAARSMVRSHPGRFVFVSHDSREIAPDAMVTALGGVVPDLVFIDGGHDFETVASDIRLAVELSAPAMTRWILLDDWWPHLGPGVQPAMAAWGREYAKHRQWGNMVLFKAKPGKDGHR